MKVDIDLERLRRLAMSANTETAATRFAYEDFMLSGNAYRAAKRSLNEWVSENGGVPDSLSDEEKNGVVGGRLLPNTPLIERRAAVSRYNVLLTEFQTAQARYDNAQAEYERLRAISSVSRQLALSGLEFAQKHMTVPSDISGLFEAEDEVDFSRGRMAALAGREVFQ